MLNEQTRAARSAFIGSSDTPAIMGLSPYRTPLDVYLSKTGQGNEQSGDWLDAGNRLEPWILDAFEQRFGVTLLRDTTHRLGEAPFGCNLDGEKVREGSGDGPSTEYIVEAKQVGVVNYSPHVYKWGEEGVDDGKGDPLIPDDVMVQVQHQLMVVCCPLAYVAALIANRGLCIYEIRPNENIMDQIFQQGSRFWRDHVNAGVAPEGTERDLDALRRLPRDLGKSAPVDPELAEERDELAKEIGALKKRKDSVEAKILSSLGDAAVGECPGWKITVKKSARKGYTVEPCEQTRLNISRIKGDIK